MKALKVALAGFFCMCGAASADPTYVVATSSKLMSDANLVPVTEREAYVRSVFDLAEARKKDAVWACDLALSRAESAACCSIGARSGARTTSSSGATDAPGGNAGSCGR